MNQGNDMNWEGILGAARRSSGGAHPGRWLSWNECAALATLLRRDEAPPLTPSAQRSPGVATATVGAAARRIVGAMLQTSDDRRAWMSSFAPTDDDSPEGWAACAPPHGADGPPTSRGAHAWRRRSGGHPNRAVARSRARATARERGGRTWRARAVS